MTETRSLRILYAAGPGNVAGTYGHWRTDRDDPSQVAMTYSGQFFDVVKRGGHKAYVIATSREPGSWNEAGFRIVHRPNPLSGRSATAYHLGQIYAGLRLTISAMRFGADVAVIADGTAHWFALAGLRLLGVRIIPTVHCVLWRKQHPRSRVVRIIERMNRRCLTHWSSAILSASEDISGQIVESTGGRNRPIVPFLPTYRAETFAGIDPPPAQVRPFRVLFAGRIERNKGVFDLLQIAQRFKAEGRGDIEFDLCGNGSALGDLRQGVRDAGLDERFRCHGHRDRVTMRRMFGESHVVIVPTTTDFVEGFNQVVAEGVLAGRPVITSNVCPALSYVRDAVVEVPADNVRAYGDAILRLCDDGEFFRTKQQGCMAAQQQFYDAKNGWAAAFEKVLGQIRL